jgi:hypothetical protein
MDTNDVSSGGDPAPDPLPDVPERPTPSGWVVVKKAPRARAKAAPPKKKTSAATNRKAASVAKKRTSGKRELIDTGRNKMYAKRGAKGRFKDMVDVGRSLSADRRSKAKTVSKSGYGDQGDAPARGKKAAARGKKTTARKAARKATRKTTRKTAGKTARKTARKKS